MRQSAAPRCVTALRELPRGEVAVALDGQPWRTLPAGVVVRAGLRVGAALDRPLARELGRALRRERALAAGARALRHRDLTRAELAQRLAHGQIGRAGTAALEALEHAGLVDDRRFAGARASTLAGRGYGDAAIRADLDRRGLDPALVVEALGALEPEQERVRALVPRRSGRAGSAAALARRLIARGFGEDSVEAAVGALVADEQGSE